MDTQEGAILGVRNEDKNSDEEVLSADAEAGQVTQHSFATLKKIDVILMVRNIP